MCCCCFWEYRRMDTLLLIIGTCLRNISLSGEIVDVHYPTHHLSKRNACRCTVWRAFLRLLLSVLHKDRWSISVRDCDTVCMVVYRMLILCTCWCVESGCCIYSMYWPVDCADVIAYFCVFQLEMFSLQLFHRKVQFTVCGFFQLDSTLLYAVNNATDPSALPSRCLVQKYDTNYK